MGPHSFLGRFESRALDSTSNGPQAAEIMLPGFHRTAEIKVARLQQRLGQSHIRADTFPSRFFPVQIHDLAYAATDGQVFIIRCNQLGCLLFGGFCLAFDSYVFVPFRQNINGVQIPFRRSSLLCFSICLHSRLVSPGNLRRITVFVCCPSVIVFCSVTFLFIVLML